MRREGFDICERRFRRLYRAQNLEVRARKKFHVQYVRGTARVVATKPNQCWSLDFLHDILLNCRKFRVLDIIDDFTRINLQLDIDFSFPSPQVTRILDEIAQACGGYPDVLRVDQGPELTALAMLQWAAEHNVRLQFSDQGKPTQNAHIESLNGRVRDEFLNLYCFRNVPGARDAAHVWCQGYNHVRPHGALNGMTPIKFAKAFNRRPQFSAT